MFDSPFDFFALLIAVIAFIFARGDGGDRLAVPAHPVPRGNAAAGHACGTVTSLGALLKPALDRRRHFLNTV
jgi:hypothetical protein